MGGSHIGVPPGAYEVIRQVLGHRSLRVTVASYTGLELDAAARHFDQTVLQDRAESRATARAIFNKRASRKRGKA